MDRKQVKTLIEEWNNKTIEFILHIYSNQGHYDKAGFESEKKSYQTELEEVLEWIDKVNE